MSIVEELFSGTVKFEVKEDGSEVIHRHPPTALALRAANTIKNLQTQLDGLARAYQSLELQYKRNLEELNEKRSVVPEHVATEGVDSVRPVYGEPEGSGSKEETGSTPETAGSEREGSSEAV